MLGASLAIPLTPSVTEALTWNAEKHKVLDSEVYLVVSNGKSPDITIKRNIRGPENQKNLISVWTGDILKNGITDSRRDYFVNEKGGAQNTAGFHSFLAEFIDFKLPTVPKSDGSECLLYLQCLFPASFIEQMRGWGGVLNGLPYQYGIRELSKRVVEFTLGLEVNSAISKRESLRARKESLTQKWYTQLNLVDELTRLQGGVVEGIPDAPIASWPPVTAPVFLVSKDQKYVKVDDVLNDYRHRVSVIQSETIPTVSQVVGQLHGERKNLDVRIRQLHERSEELNDELAAAEDYQSSISKRIESLEGDLRKNQDEQKLQKMDGKLWGIDDSQCPTCGQDWPAALVKTKAGTQVMTIEENIAHIKSEISAFKAMANKGSVFIRAKRAALEAVHSEIGVTAESIRSINDSMVSRGTAPSMEAYKLHASLQYEIGQLEKAKALFDEHLDVFGKISKEYGEVISATKALPRGELSNSDNDKIASFERLIRDQLRRYGFTSIEPVENVEVNRSNYHIISDGHEIVSTISASDLIRLIWAYHIGLRKAASSNGGNHLGTLFFDEPRQQSANPFSFSALLQQFASEVGDGFQTILATSEETTVLKQALGDAKVQLIDFPKNPGFDYIFSPITPVDLTQEAAPK
jgi:DNA repair exonuclease SbcCD ATPase subunit